MLNRIVIAFGFCLAIHAAHAQDRNKLVGAWKLVSFDLEFQATGERKPTYGKNPTGYLILTSEGRLMGLITAEGRKPAETDQDRAALFRTMIAYTGTYHVEADKFSTKVEASWNESWTGTNQVRFYKLDGNRLDIISAWAPAANLEGRPIVRGILTWERAR